MDAIVYDCEILNAIPDKTPPEPGITYCGGWGDFHGMGVSVICAYDYKTDRYHTFLRDNFGDFLNLVYQRPNLIGFNNGGFDDLLIAAAIGFKPPPTLKIHDLLSEVWVSCGLKRRFGGSQYAGYGLQDLSLANGLPGKTSKGTHAPVMWQRGDHGQVIDYCLNDVWLTKKLIDQCREVGHLRSPKNGLPMSITAFASL